MMGPLSDTHRRMIIKKMFSYVTSNQELVRQFDFNKKNWNSDFTWSRQAEFSFGMWLVEFLISHGYFTRRERREALGEVVTILRHYGWKVAGGTRGESVMQRASNSGYWREDTIAQNRAAREELHNAFRATEPMAIYPEWRFWPTAASAIEQEVSTPIGINEIREAVDALSRSALPVERDEVPL